jgi:hypothetical protein
MDHAMVRLHRELLGRCSHRDDTFERFGTAIRRVVRKSRAGIGRCAVPREGSTLLTETTQSRAIDHRPLSILIAVRALPLGA